MKYRLKEAPSNDSPIAQEIYWADYDDWIWNMRQCYMEGRERELGLVRENMKEWMKEMKHDPKMTYVFREKEKEAQEVVRQFQTWLRSYLQSFHKRGASSKDLICQKERLHKDLSVLEARVKRWAYLKDMSSGKLKERQQREIDLDDLKQDVRIEELIGIERKAYGRSQINCPIHTEKTPSCVIYHNQNSFYCYGCHVGGSVIDFVMARDEVSIKEAVKMLTGMC